MNKSYQVGWWLIVLTTIVINVAVIPFILIGNITNEYLISLIGELGIIIPIILGVFYIKKNSLNLLADIGIKKFSSKHLVPSSILTTGCQYFVLFVTMPLQLILIVMFGSSNATSQMTAPQSIFEFLFAFFVLCIIAPILEELLCRGVLIKLFEKYGIFVSLIASSIAFALLHFEAITLIPIFFMGLLFGIFKITTGSVLITIFMHSLNNFISLCQLTFMGESIANSLTIVSVITAILFPFVFLYMLKKWKKYLKVKHTHQGTEKTGFSVGATICFLLVFGYNLINFINRLINGYCTKDLLMLIGLYK